MKSTASALLLALVALFAACTPAFADSAARILTANRAAVGTFCSPASVHTAYRYSGQGLVGTVFTDFDVVSGAHVVRSDLGAIVVGNGFDGAMPWMLDISGAFTPQDGGDRVRVAVNEAYRRANLWWRSDRGGAEIVFVGREMVEGVPSERLSVTPKGGARFDAWFDRRSHLLTQIAERQMFFDTRTLYHAYARRGGVMVPTQMVVDGGTGQADFATMTLTEFSVRPAGSLSAYSRPAAAATGVTFDGGQRSVSLPFRLLNNHVYIEGMVDGHGPYTFIVDTGGHTILSSRVVREAGLAPAGAAPSAGAGAATTTNGYAKVREIGFGPIRMRDQTAITMDIYDPAVEGIRVDGMVGFELFRRVAVRIDYGKQVLTLVRFEDFDGSKAGTPIPFAFYDHLPQISGRLDDIPILLDIDTGSRTEADITSPFVRTHNLLNRFPGGVTAMTGWGVGGPSMSQVVRIPSLTLGRVRVDRPVIGLSRASAGSFSDANFGGNIGSGLLKRFVVSFDYSRQLMYLQPLSPPPADVGTFDRSGMWINAGEDGFVVAYVSPGGAADAAGIVKGDVVVAVNGLELGAEKLSEVRSLLRSTPAGEVVRLTVRRKGEQRTIDLAVKDQI